MDQISHGAIIISALVESKRPVPYSLQNSTYTYMKGQPKKGQDRISLETVPPLKMSRRLSVMPNSHIRRMGTLRSMGRKRVGRVRDMSDSEGKLGGTWEWRKVDGH